MIIINDNNNSSIKILHKADLYEINLKVYEVNNF